MAFPGAFDPDAFNRDVVGHAAPRPFEDTSATAPFAWMGFLLSASGLFLMVVGLIRGTHVFVSLVPLCAFASLLLLCAKGRGRVLIRVVAMFTVMFALLRVGNGTEHFLLPASSDFGPHLERAGAWLLLAGGAALVLTGSPARAGRGLRWVSVPMLLVVGLPVAVVPLMFVPNIEHTVANEAPPVWDGRPATTLSEHVWSWSPARGGRIVSVVPTPSVGLVLLTDGAVGLDPLTGQEVWSYRNPAMRADDHGYTSSWVDPSGERVHLAFGLDRRHDGRVVLDTATGEAVQVEYFRVWKRAFEEDPKHRVRTDTGSLRPGDGEVRHDSRDAEHAWEYSVEERCHPGRGDRWPDHAEPVGETVVVTLVCGYEGGPPRDLDRVDLDGRIVALDLGTGREIWRVRTAHVQSDEEHGLLGPRDVRVSADGSAVYTPEGDVVVALATGEVLHDDSEPFWGEDGFAGVSADSFTVKVREGDSVRFVERDWSGEEPRATGAGEIDEDRPASGALVLDRAVVRILSGGPGWELVVHPWGDSAARSIPMVGEPFASSRTSGTEARLVPVHGTVFVHIDDEGQSRFVLGLR